MYLDFFDFKKPPFDNDFNDEFFFTSQTHEEAYSRLEYVIENRKMCGVLCGAYGCGKTFILKRLIKNLSVKNYIFSEVVNPAVDDIGILKLIAYNFLNYKVPQVKSDIIISLIGFLKDSAKDSKHCVVIIDEAQNIESEKVFEEIRMLLNYTDDSKPLLTVILAGQSDLHDRILSNKQLLQRVYLSYEIKPLSEKETFDYINYRLTVSMNRKSDIFSEKAISLIYQRSGGIPRWINSISDMSLLTAFTKNIKKIDQDIVEEAYLSMKGNV